MVKQSATLDSSFWINAQRVGLVGDVLDRFELHFTREVGAELSEAYESGREFWNLVRAGLIAPAPPADDIVKSFGRGERSAMSLAIEHPDWFLLVDDRRPFEEAHRLGIRAICSPTLVVQLFREGIINLVQAHAVLAKLEGLNTVSPRLVALSRTQLQLVRRQRRN